MHSVRTGFGGKTGLQIVFCLGSFVIQMPAFAQCVQQTEVAVRFMNEYIRFLEGERKNSTPMSVEDWLLQSQLVTPNLRGEFKKVTKAGYESDPEIGWDFDLLLDAQDWPDQGLLFYACKQKNFVELQGKNWAEFKLVVKVVPIGSVYRVDGAGVVNIPQTLRAKHRL